MQIKSNTLGKLQKIKNGNVFDSPLIFIRELLQNSQRSKAKNVNFLVSDGKFICSDDGCGCKDPENVFTLDLSDWESTSEGYGIGFWSCLSIPNIKTITVESKNWVCKVDAERLFATGDLTVDRQKCETRSGFKVIIESDYFDDRLDEVEEYLFDVSKYLPFRTSINNIVIPPSDFILEYHPEAFSKEYNNAYFRGKLSIQNGYYDTIDIYYDRRLVTKTTLVNYVQGVIEIKSGKITLKEPDRTSYTRDDKYYAFIQELEKCTKDLYLSYVKEYGVDDDNYEHPMKYWLDVKDYEKYLVFEDDMFEASLGKEEKPAKKAEVHTPLHVSSDIDTSKFQRDNMVTTQHFGSAQTASVAISPVTVKKESNTASFKDNVKKMKRSIWVSRSEYSAYQDDIQKAKYKGLNVIVAKNSLYAAFLSKCKIPHISELDNVFFEDIIKTNIELKNGKEEAMISLLKPVVEKYGLDDDCFLIANLSIESSFVLDNKIVFKRKIANKKDDIQIYGITDRYHIYLDRTALALNRFHIKKDNLGIWELKAIMNCVNTVAHELSHYLYNTVDNTPEHFANEIRLQQEIIALYM
jgi:hypothetical protein